MACSVVKQGLNTLYLAFPLNGPFARNVYLRNLIPLTETKKTKKKAPCFFSVEAYRVLVLEDAEEQIRAYKHKCLKKR